MALTKITVTLFLLQFGAIGVKNSSDLNGRGKWFVSVSLAERGCKGNEKRKEADTKEAKQYRGKIKQDVRYMRDRRR